MILLSLSLLLQTLSPIWNEKFVFNNVSCITPIILSIVTAQSVLSTAAVLSTEFP